jgi:hypothetical protein
LWSFDEKNVTREEKKAKEDAKHGRYAKDERI